MLTVRAPQLIQFYNYLTGDGYKNDSKLNDILDAFDKDNVILSGHSFGGVTSWYASHQIDNDNLKGLLLLDPAFGILRKEEAKQMKWNKPVYILSSEQWLKNRKYVMEVTNIIVKNNNIDSNKNIWEYGDKFIHHDTSDVPIWGPSFMTGARKLYTAQEWSDLVCKRCASFIADIIPSFKKQFSNLSVFKYNTNCLKSID